MVRAEKGRWSHLRSFWLPLDGWLGLVCLVALEQVPLALQHAHLLYEQRTPVIQCRQAGTEQAVLQSAGLFNAPILRLFSSIRCKRSISKRDSGLGARSDCCDMVASVQASDAVC